MREGFDAYEYLAYLRTHWRFLAIAVVVAVALAIVVTLMLPVRYTATASIIIEPPAGNDPRSATAVSPVYLESLRTYEHFASSDSLFQRALDHFQFPRSGQTLESIKRRVLKVGKIKDTKVLEISVTLADPPKAQALVQYIAEETVAMSQAVARQADQELISETEKQVDATRVRLAAAQKAQGEQASRDVIEGLRTELESLAALQARTRRELMEVRVDTADFAANTRAAGDLASARARAAALEKQVADLDREIAEKNRLFAERQARHDVMTAELRAAQLGFDSATQRLEDIRGGAGLRGERLRVIDPGVVPQRPSSPNLPLNVIGAFLLAAVAALLYLTLRFSYARHAQAVRYRDAFKVER